MKLSEKLLKLRKENGMSQEDLAEKLNTSRQAISKWENGQGFPETEKLLMIANIFDVSVDYLLKEVNDTPHVDHQAEQGFYASKAFIDGYIKTSKKEANILASGIFITITATIFPNLFPEQKQVANVVMFILIAVGLLLLALFAFQFFFKADKYKAIGSKPLIFDNDFLKEFKEKYKVVMKIYITMMIFAFALIIGGVVLANVMKGNKIDVIIVVMVAAAIYMMMYAGYMMIVNNTIINGDKRLPRK